MKLLGIPSPLINRRRVAVVAAAAALLAAGCGDDSGSEDNGGADPEALEEVPDDSEVAEENATGGPADTPGQEGAAEVPADLQPLLLSLDDMPAGWGVFPENNDAEQVCGNPRPAGRVTFVGDLQEGPIVGHVVDTGPGWYDATVDAFSSCDTTDSEGNTWRGSDLVETPQVGDRSQGFRMTITDPSGQMQTSDIILYEANGVAGGVLASAGDTTALLAEYAPVAVGLAG